MPTNLIEIVQAQSWAILPDKLDTIHQVLAAHVAGQKIEYEASPEKPYSVIDRVAVVPIHGVIAKRMNLMQQFSGGVSTELVGRDIKAALDDPEVRSIVLDIDSPGGTVDGTEALADLVYQARGVKPIVGFANGMMASAAYWIGSGAKAIITSNTGDIGSIGVVQAHYDYSKANEKAGVKRTFIYAGRYKTIGNDSEPLSEDGKAYIQAGVDYIYSMFVENVSRHRGMTIAETLKAAEGRIFIGKQALDVGLVDQIGNFDMALEVAQKMGFDQYFYGKTLTGAKPPIKQEGVHMPTENVTLEKLEAEAPQLLGEIRQAAKNSVDLEPAMKEGAENERQKILALASVHFGEVDASKFEALVKSGMTVEMYRAAKQAISIPEPKVEKTEKMDQMLDAIQKSGAENPGAGGPAGPANFTEAWKSIKDEKGCSTEDAMKQAVRKYPDLHKTYIGRSGNA